jgi:hypothetical protein
MFYFRLRYQSTVNIRIHREVQYASGFYVHHSVVSMYVCGYKGSEMTRKDAEMTFKCAWSHGFTWIPEAEFLDVIRTKVTATNGVHPPPSPEQKWFELVCNVNIVYRNLMSENFQDYAQKLQRHCRFVNSASGLFRSGSGLKLQFVWTLYFFLAVSLLALEIKDFLEFPACYSKGTLAWDGLYDQFLPMQD